MNNISNNGLVGDSDNKSYDSLIERIGKTYTEGQLKVRRIIHQEILLTYWKIGRHIVEYEQKGNLKAEYGKEMIAQLSRDLKDRFGKGFGRSNLIYMRLLYVNYPKSGTLSHQLR